MSKDKEKRPKVNKYAKEAAAAAKTGSKRKGLTAGQKRREVLNQLRSRRG